MDGVGYPTDYVKVAVLTDPQVNVFYPCKFTYLYVQRYRNAYMHNMGMYT